MKWEYKVVAIPGVDYLNEVEVSYLDVADSQTRYLNKYKDWELVSVQGAFAYFKRLDPNRLKETKEQEAIRLSRRLEELAEEGY